MPTYDPDRQAVAEGMPLLNHKPSIKPGQVQDVANIKKDKEFLLCNTAGWLLRVKAEGNPTKREGRWVVKVSVVGKQDPTVFELDLAPWGVCAYLNGYWNPSNWIEFQESEAQ